MKLLKKIVMTILVLSLGTAAGFAVFYAAHTSLTKLPTVEEIRHPDNVSPHLSSEEQATIKKSRKSTVQVLSLSYDGKMASSTGTYIESDGRYYILTVAHGLVGPCAVTKVWTPESGFTDCEEIAVLDPMVDYAIIEIAEIPSRKAINLERSLPRATDWEEKLSSQSKVYYTGYPNGTGPLTIPGTIIGYDVGDYIYLYSYGWSGASGSGVYSADGKLIGYLLAIDVGRTEFGVQAIEGVVIVVPTFKIDWTALRK